MNTDRLTHRMHILEANGESYRLRQSKGRLKRKGRSDRQDPRPRFTGEGGLKKSERKIDGPRRAG